MCLLIHTARAMHATECAESAPSAARRPQVTLRPLVLCTAACPSAGVAAWLHGLARAHGAPMCSSHGACGPHSSPAAAGKACLSHHVEAGCAPRSVVPRHNHTARLHALQRDGQHSNCMAACILQRHCSCCHKRCAPPAAALWRTLVLRKDASPDASNRPPNMNRAGPTATQRTVIDRARPESPVAPFRQRKLHSLAPSQLAPCEPRSHLAAR